MGPESRIGHLHVWPGRLTAQARDVVLEGPGFRLEAPVARVTLSLPTLLGRAFALRALELQQPRLTLWSEPRPAAPRAAPAASRPILLGDVRIADGTLIYRDPKGGDWRVDGIRVQGTVGTTALQIETEDIRWDRERPIVLEP